MGQTAMLSTGKDPGSDYGRQKRGVRRLLKETTSAVSVIGRARLSTLWQFEIAIEHGPFTVRFPMKNW